MKINNIKYFVAGLIAIAWASLVVAVVVYIDDDFVRVLATASFLAGIFFISGLHLIKESLKKPKVVV